MLITADHFIDVARGARSVSESFRRKISVQRGRTLKFRATVIPSGNATAIEVPPQVMEELGPHARPLVVITINGHTWRSRVALMRGCSLVGISAANRTAADIALGDKVEIELKLDREPREVSLSPDLAKALNKIPKAREAFERLPFGLRRKHVAAIEDAKIAETRQRRIAKLVAQAKLDRA
jgi:hypothetical protein